MLSPQRDNRPGGNRAAIECSSGRTVPSLVDLTPDQWDVAVVFYQSGYLHGLDAGREHERQEVAALQVAAAQIVHAMAEIPPRDVVEDRRQADRRAAWWAARRGESA